MPGGYNMATQYRYDGAADPHLVSLPHTAGGYGVLPTGKQVRLPVVCTTVCLHRSVCAVATVTCVVAVGVAYTLTL